MLITVATKVTLFRLLLVTPITILLFIKTPDYFGIAIILFWIAILSDFLDGFIARKFHQETNLGSFLDALTDKILVYVLIFSFLKLGLYYSIIVVFMFLRDIIVDFIRNFFAIKGNVIASNKWGKMKFSFQCVSLNFCFFFFIVNPKFQLYFFQMANFFLVLALLVSLPGLFNMLNNCLLIKKGQISA